MITEIHVKRMNLILILKVIICFRNFILFHFLICAFVYIFLVLFSKSIMANSFFFIYGNFILSFVLHELGHLITYLILTKCKHCFLIKSKLFEISILTVESTCLNNVLVAFSGPALCFFVGIIILKWSFPIALVYCMHVINLYPAFQDGENIVQNLIRRKNR